MKKRLFSILLTVCMVLSMLPVGAFASPGDSDPIPIERKTTLDLTSANGCNESATTTGPMLSMLPVRAFASPGGSDPIPIERKTTLDLTSTNGSYESATTTGQLINVNFTTTNVTDSAEGWAWYKTAADGYSANTLVLSGANITGQDSSVESYGIILPPDATIKLLDGTTNTVISGRTDGRNYYSRGITCRGGLMSIEGTGTLNTTGGMASDGYSFGIHAENLTINSGTITATAGNASNGASFGIYAKNLTINSGTITATTGNASNGASYGIHAENLIINSGTITVTGGNAKSTSYGIAVQGVGSTIGTITIKGGNLTVQSGNAQESCGIGVRGTGTITISGGSGSATSGTGTRTSMAFSKELASGSLSLTGTSGGTARSWDVTSEVFFDGGTGTQDDPYQIATAKQLRFLSAVINQYVFIDKDSPSYGQGIRKVALDQDAQTYAYLQCAHYKLTADIVLNDTTDWESWNDNTTGLNSWMPIGQADGYTLTDTYAKAFAGTFDGDNHTISGMYHNALSMGVRSGAAHLRGVGLFGAIKDGSIKNVTVAKSYISNRNALVGSVVGVIGASEKVSVDNCTNSSTVIGTFSNIGGNGTVNSMVGGVVGLNYGIVQNCQNTGTVINAGSGDNGGGVVGCNSGKVDYCTNSGTVRGTYVNTYSQSGQLGGIVGTNAGILKNCTNSGIIDSEYSECVGGVTAVNAVYGIVENCQNSSRVIGRSYIGGVVGKDCNGNNGIGVKNCQNSGMVIGDSFVGGVIGGGGLVGSVVQMQNCYSPKGLTIKKTGELATRDIGTSSDNPIYIGHLIGYSIGTSTGTGNSSNPIVSGVTVSPSNATVAQGGTQQFTATVTDETNQTVTWSILNDDENVSIDSAGKVTVTSSAVGGKIYVVKATSTQNPKKYGTASMTINVQTPAKPSITPTTLLSGIVGTAYSETLQATGYPTPTWSKASGNLPDGLTLSSEGKITGTPTKSGTFSFTVKVTNASGSDTKELAITVTSNITGLTVTPSTATVKKTKTQQFTANVTGTGTGEVGVTWSVSGSTKSTIDATGLLTVNAFETANTLTVTATSKADSTKSATATVTVTDAPKLCTVTFDSDGGSTVLSISGIEEGSLITLPNAPTKENHRFDGWYTEKTGGGKQFTGATVVNTSITVYAKWTKLVTVSGIVVEEDNTPISGVSVTLLPTYGTAAAITGADGKFHFDNIPEDYFTVTATFEDTSSVTANVTGDYSNVKLVKPKPYLTITRQPQDGYIIKGIPGQNAVFEMLGERTPHLADSVAHYWYWLLNNKPDVDKDKRIEQTGSQLTINETNNNIPTERGIYKLYGYAYVSPVTAPPELTAYTRVAALKVVGTNTIAGEVKKENGDLVQGATVKLEYVGTWPYGSSAITSSSNSQTTLADGKYQFKLVPDGNYKLTITLPDGGKIVYGPYAFPGVNPTDPSEPIDPDIVIPDEASIQISEQPQDATVKKDTAVTLTAAANATNGTAVTYQWYKNTQNANSGGTEISGATAKDYKSPTETKGTTYYYCVVSGTGLESVTTRPVKVTVFTYGILAGTVQTDDKQTIAGATVELVQLTCTDPNPPEKFTTSSNPQTTTADGKFKFIEVPNGTYKLKITLPSGEVFEEQPISVPNVNPDLPITPPAKPTISITSQPKSMTVALGDTAGLSISAGVSNSNAVIYQWYKNTVSSTTGGTAISGATSSSYLAPTAAKGIAYYYCEVKASGAEPKTSNVAKVTVRNSLYMTIEGAVKDDSSNTVKDATVILAPTAGISPNPRTTKVDGKYKFEMLPLGKYTLTITLSGGGTLIKEIDPGDPDNPNYPTYPNGEVDIVVPATNSITITQQPKAIEVTSEMTAGFAVKAVATKSATLTYQWYKNTTNANNGGTKLEDKTTAALTLDKQPAGVSYYYCVVSSQGASDKVTHPAKLTVTKAPDKTGDLNGSVVEDEDGKPVVGAEVKLMKYGTDGTQFGSTVVTGKDGKYEFQVIPYGSYSLVAQKNAQIVTKQVTIKEVSITENLTLPNGGKLTKVTIQGSSTPSVAVRNLDEMFTPQDSAIAKQSGAQVEIKLLVEKKDIPADKEEMDAALGQNQEVGMYLEAKLVKIITGTVVDNATENIQPPSGQTLHIVLDLPTALQGKEGYQVIRAHSENGITSIKVIIPNYDQVMQTLAFDADAFSTYAIVYNNLQSNTGGGGSSSGGSSGGSSYNAYDIQITKEGNGTIVPDPGADNKVTIPEWSDQTFTFTPEKGYMVFDVLVDGKSVGASTSYSFKNITKEHTLKVIFRKDSSLENPKTDEKPNDVKFDDVKDEDWFAAAVYTATRKGWFQGTSDTTFSPYLDTTRGMIVTVLHRMENEPRATVTSIFDDVTIGSWYYNGVTWGQEHKIVKGYGNGKYGPQDNITREQMVAILYRYAQFKGYDVSKTSSLSQFTDASTISGYAKLPMTWAVANGLISGKGNNRLDPKTGATRAEVAAILTRFYELFSNK
ncbi:hypothetical protein CS063_07800 [Sporanaerobium hydrogeniformans]|uniref:Uncharacterized protein n=1 Tax=Sporanaerobium hydrogeniformans TaxID=3072179 RepID=A0AC61DDV9_9FIRM|nr:carboxypeptidase regulatory-like domain-containing protein [Sporanaerobium hydrogeniformans]PHV70916.1 hypothetical protein CS063_07800 [Sporanaerobium hydrogeniformans]